MAERSDSSSHGRRSKPASNASARPKGSRKSNSGQSGERSTKSPARREGEGPPARRSGDSQAARRSGDGREGRPAGPREPERAGPRSWGSLGRKGAARVGQGESDKRGGGVVDRSGPPNAGRGSDEWVRVDVRDDAAKAVDRGRRPNNGDKPTRKRTPKGADTDLAPKERRGREPRRPGPGTGGADARHELVKALGATRGDRANLRLRDAAAAFERDRFEEARSLLVPIAKAAPQALAARELLGLTYYRLGKWKEAVRELEAFRGASGTTEQHPVLADCYRAQRRHDLVEELWEELRAASPSAELVAEGRIVMAGSFGDRGRFGDAIKLLDRSHAKVTRPKSHHLGEAYALADLYERAGEVARARELFRWVTEHDPTFSDAAERCVALT